MSKIPMPGPFGISWMETDPLPLTQKEEEALNAIHAKLDYNLTLVYQKKLTALGYPNSFSDAQRAYEDHDLGQKIDDDYTQLEATHRMNEMIGLVENIQRKLRG